MLNSAEIACCKNKNKGLYFKKKGVKLKGECYLERSGEKMRVQNRARKSLSVCFIIPLAGGPRGAGRQRHFFNDMR